MRLSQVTQNNYKLHKQNQSSVLNNWTFFRTIVFNCCLLVVIYHEVINVVIETWTIIFNHSSFLNCTYIHLLINLPWILSYVKWRNTRLYLYLLHFLTIWSHLKSVFTVWFQKKDILPCLHRQHNCYKQQLLAANIADMSDSIISNINAIRGYETRSKLSGFKQTTAYSILCVIKSSHIEQFEVINVVILEIIFDGFAFPNCTYTRLLSTLS